MINLGFSGSGIMDASVTSFLAKIDAALFVVDCRSVARARRTLGGCGSFSDLRTGLSFSLTLERVTIQTRT